MLNSDNNRLNNHILIVRPNIGIYNTFFFKRQYNPFLSQLCNDVTVVLDFCSDWWLLLEIEISLIHRSVEFIDRSFTSHFLNEEHKNIMACLVGDAFHADEQKRYSLYCTAQ
jgi:hypothetical protein